MRWQAFVANTMSDVNIARTILGIYGKSMSDASQNTKLTIEYNNEYFRYVII